MSVFKVHENYYVEMLRVLHEQRKNGKFCDVKLVIGTRSILAHRNVLAAGSPYFRSLFSGNFSEVDKPEVDLSSVTDNNMVVEAIIDFLYTGEVQIDKSNLKILVQLSSYFLISELQEICCKYMQDDLSLTSCLKYFTYMIGHGYFEFENTVATLIKARLHDYLIYRGELLELSPDELTYLVQNEFFEHCSVSDVLSFVAEYVRIGLTERHVTAGCELLKFVEILNDQHSGRTCTHVGFNESCTLDLKSAFENMKLALEKEENLISGMSRNFIQQFKEQFTKLVCPKIQDFQPYDMHVVFSGKRHSEELIDEEILITCSPTPGEFEYMERTCKWLKKTRVTGIKTSESHPGTPLNLIDNSSTDNIEIEAVIGQRDPRITFCAYDPGPRQWYLLDTTNFKLLYEVYDICEFLPMSSCLEDTCILYFVDYQTRLMLFYNLHDCSYHRIDYSFLLTYDTEIPSFISKGEKIYVVFNRLTPYNEEYGDPNFRVSKICFECYELTVDDNWDLLFMTQDCDVLNYDRAEELKFHTGISSASNEMMIVLYRTEIVACFVSDLNEKKPTAVQIYSSGVEEKLNIYARDEGTDYVPRLHLIEDHCQLNLISADENEVGIILQYTFNSKKLTPVKTTWITLYSFKIDHDKDMHFKYWLSMNTRKSLFCFYGNKEGTSALVELAVDSSGTLRVKGHIPPPFKCCSSVGVCKVKREFLKRLKPVTRYLMDSV